MSNGGGIAFVFAPVGWQREDMGRALYERGGPFQRVLEDVARDMSSELPMQLLDVLYPPKDGSLLDQGGMIDSTYFAQPALYAVEVALDALWRKMGVCPSAVVGHSIGEFAAAASGNAGLSLLSHDGQFDDDLDDDDSETRAEVVGKFAERRRIASALTRKEGAQLVAARARLMAATPAAGCMMVVRATAAECLDAINAAEKNGSIVSIGALNGPRSTVLSGDLAAVAKVVAKLKEAYVERGDEPPKAQKVKGTSHGDHTPRMQPVADQLSEAAAAILAPGDALTLAMFGQVEEELTFVSTVTGGIVCRQELRTGAYWSQHMTGTVKFTEALDCLLNTCGIRAFLDIGDGMLSRLGRSTLKETPFEFTTTWYSSLAQTSAEEIGFFTESLSEARQFLEGVTAKRPILDKEDEEGKVYLELKFQPPPKDLRENPDVPPTEPSKQTFAIRMPKDAPFVCLQAYLEHEYGMMLDIHDALALANVYEKKVAKGSLPGPLSSEDEFDAVFGRAEKKGLKAAYFIVTAKLDEKKQPMLPQQTPASVSKRERARDFFAETKEERTWTSEKDDVKFEGALLEKDLQRTLRCPEVEPAYEEEQRSLIAKLPSPSLLPESEFPSIAMGGRCLDLWGYRWGQRTTDLWLYVALPADVDVSSIKVDFGTTAMSIKLGASVLVEGALWETDLTAGLDADSAAWVVLEYEGVKVLHVECYKKQPYWWKAIWQGHPTIEPWEVPNWKEVTFNDGYTSTPLLSIGGAA